MDQVNKPQSEQPPASEPARKVDQVWKENVEKEKQEAQANKTFVPPEVDFKFFITTLTLQASIALGHMANPATGQAQKDPAQAKFIIDTLAMLQEKTKSNLNKEEADLLENLLYELRVAYLAKDEK